MYSKKIAFPVVVGLVLSVAIIMPNGNPSSKVDAIGREMNLGTQPCCTCKGKFNPFAPNKLIITEL